MTTSVVFFSFVFVDSIYTERYMSTPQDNALGYNTSDVTRNVENIRHKKFYLLHGTADDNVHYQQAMMLAKVLEKEDILFHSQVCQKSLFLLPIVFIFFLFCLLYGQTLI